MQLAVTSRAKYYKKMFEDTRTYSIVEDKKQWGPDSTLVGRCYLDRFESRSPTRRVGGVVIGFPLTDVYHVWAAFMSAPKLLWEMSGLDFRPKQ